jgi:glycosyltransferase involved in cell wall biosynthesis
MNAPLVILAPIERLAERYSDQWYHWIQRDLRAAGVPYVRAGSARQEKITAGEFLDVYGTNIFKALQAADVCRALRQAAAAGRAVTVLYLDGWNPTVEMVAYVRSLTGAPVRIVGLFHAGSYDPHDYLFQKGCAAWARGIEEAWLSRIYDRVIVATGYHARLIASTFGPSVVPALSVVPFPVYTNARLLGREKTDLVVFPHRLAPEKQPELFDALRAAYEAKYRDRPVEWTKTKDVCRTKREYYELLARGKVAFSAALQETFGIAMLEAENLGCVPVAPRRCSYPETLAPWPLYDTLPEAVEQVREALVDYRRPSPRYGSSMAPIVRSLA